LSVTAIFVRAGGRSGDNAWTSGLVLFLRIMPVLSVAKGFILGAGDGFCRRRGRCVRKPVHGWQTATVYFAVINSLPRGLWLADAMGCVVWLTTCVSMAGDRA